MELSALPCPREKHDFPESHCEKVEHFLCSCFHFLMWSSSFVSGFSHTQDGWYTWTWVNLFTIWCLSNQSVVLWVLGVWHRPAECLAFRSRGGHQERRQPRGVRGTEPVIHPQGQYSVLFFSPELCPPVVPHVHCCLVLLVEKIVTQYGFNFSLQFPFLDPILICWPKFSHDAIHYFKQTCESHSFLSSPVLPACWFC